MKSTLKSAFFALAACALLAACGGNAHAGTFNKNFVDDTGVVFQVDTAARVEQSPGYVVVTRIGVTPEQYRDSSGALFNKIITNTDFASHFVQVVGSQRYMNITVTSKVTCFNSPYYGLMQSTFTYPSTPAAAFDDNCATYNAVKAQANQ